MTQSREAQLGRLAHEWGLAIRANYCYLLGLYLGDGHISRNRSVYRLRITLGTRYPGIIEECKQAIAAVMPRNAVATVLRRSNCLDVSCYSALWPDLIPQHGPGLKHSRKIVLEPWQRRLVEIEPEPFIRGLFQSDGSYFSNPVRSSKGKLYTYDRYMFTNHSEDIRDLFRWACDLIGVETRPVGWRNISVARRASVARLNEFLGPKR